ncbi:hypothetical protein [Fusibacter sp. 3D3]|uniref:hypothetical protein n=1 Tax=Fusibacter sp. 3D3 TaxID=1048380 RepID=UPI001112FFAA|nr:hypothetical protein [Fusibacter sp. 3D3]
MGGKDNFRSFFSDKIQSAMVDSGALETLLLEAISEKEEDRAIVERSISYIDEIHPIASKYLSKNRLKLKACLGVTWAIQYPEKLFSFIDEQIRSVKWEESKVLERCFEQLKSI